MRGLIFAGVMAGMLGAIPMQTMADGYQPVTDKRAFLSLITGRDLTRRGIALTVTPDGQIQGRAFGRPVTGAWTWTDGFFCRDMFWGKMGLGANCQAVKVNGQTLRFISDQGKGRYADLTLD